MAGIGGQAVTEAKEGTIGSLQAALKRLCELRSRLGSINTALHGPKPEDANTKPPQPSNLAAHVQMLHEVLNDCEIEVNAIYQSLGL